MVQFSPGQFQVAIIGAGPAGLALAASLSSKGVQVCVISPDFESPWENTYCGWVDELTELGLDHFVLRSWPKVQFSYESRSDQVLDRRYCQIDNDTMRREFLEVCRNAQCQFIGGKVSSISEDGQTVSLVDGTQIGTKLVVDCSGGYTHFTRKLPSSFEVGYQIFYGETIRLSEPHGLNLDTFVLMDWNQVESTIPVLSFVYVMPIDDVTLFAEETVLTTPGKVSALELRRRLYERFEQKGWRKREVLAVEKAAFPMGGGLPATDCAWVAFGAAAGMNHPASGFLVVSMLRRLPDAVDGIFAYLESNSNDTSKYWARLWSEDEKSKYHLLSLAQDAFHKDQHWFIENFFYAFGQLLPRDQSILISGTLTSGDLLTTIGKFCLRAKLSVQLMMIKTVLSTGVRRFGSAFFYAFRSAYSKAPSKQLSS